MADFPYSFHHIRRESGCSLKETTHFFCNCLYPHLNNFLHIPYMRNVSHNVFKFLRFKSVYESLFFFMIFYESNYCTRAVSRHPYEIIINGPTNLSKHFVNKNFKNWKRGVPPQFPGDGVPWISNRNAATLTNVVSALYLVHQNDVLFKRSRQVQRDRFTGVLQRQIRRYTKLQCCFYVFDEIDLPYTSA